MGVRRHGREVYRDARWPALRLAAKRRDDWRCRQCGAHGRLEVDHVTPLREAPERAFELSNLQCLCVSCHGGKTARETGIAPLPPERKRWRKLLHTPTPKLQHEEETTPCLSP